MVFHQTFHPSNSWGLTLKPPREFVRKPASGSSSSGNNAHHEAPRLQAPCGYRFRLFKTGMGKYIEDPMVTRVYVMDIDFSPKKIENPSILWKNWMGSSFKMRICFFALQTFVRIRNAVGVDPSFDRSASRSSRLPWSSRTELVIQWQVIPQGARSFKPQVENHQNQGFFVGVFWWFFLRFGGFEVRFFGILAGHPVKKKYVMNLKNFVRFIITCDGMRLDALVDNLPFYSS